MPRPIGAFFAGFVAALAFAGCSCKTGGDAPAPSATTSSAPASASIAPTAAPTRERAADVLKPIYPPDDGTPPDPLVAKYCDAVMGLPQKKTEECCGGATAFSLAAECKRTLGFAFRSGAVKLDAAAVDACAAAIESATATCDWVGGVTPFPAACDGIIQGTRAQDAECRSSLECQGTLRCQGVSTIDMGKCGPPRADRFQCDVAIDVLATSTGQRELDRAHPECEGYCQHRQCQPLVAIGAACKSNLECGRARCIAGVCADKPLPKEGEACAAGECAEGLGCVQAKCATPKSAGEACASDVECRGACVTEDAGKKGRCDKRCPSFTFHTPQVPQGKGTGTPGRVPPTFNRRGGR